MTKAEFLRQLRDGKVAAQDNREALAQIPESAFVPFDERHPIKPDNNWDEKYFREQVSIAERDNFAHERCAQLIDYKQKLQEMGVKGFALPKVNPQSTPTPASAQDKTSSADDELDALLQKAKAQLQGYQPDPSMQQYLKVGNVALVRATLAADLTNNRLDAADLIQRMLYVHQQCPNAFEPYNASKFHPLFDTNKDVWTPDYFDQQTSYLSRNFALERVHHIINVRDYLRRQGHDSFRKIAAHPRQSAAGGSRENKPSHPSNHREGCGAVPWKVAAIVGCGALLVLAIAFVLTHNE